MSHCRGAGTGSPIVEPREDLAAAGAPSLPQMAGGESRSLAVSSAILPPSSPPTAFASALSSPYAVKRRSAASREARVTFFKVSASLGVAVMITSVPTCCAAVMKACISAKSLVETSSRS